MPELKDLIAKLEAVSEGSRELDDLIMAATDSLAVPHFEEDLDGDWFEVFEPRHYTTSIDAALMLVPAIDAPKTPAKRWPATIDIRRHDDGTGSAVVRECDMTPDGADDELCVEASAATPALAICIAALKAGT